MRGIKFKIWDTIRSSMTKPFDLHMIMRFSRMDVLIPLQYTGLKDSKGKEIYEGDILCGENLFGYEGDYVRDVRYTPCRFQCYVKYPNGEYGGIILSEAEVSEHNLRVIGNIYENPELLKQ